MKFNGMNTDELTDVSQLVGEFIEPLCISPAFIGGLWSTGHGRSIETKTDLFDPVSWTPSNHVPVGQVASITTWPL